MLKLVELKGRSLPFCHGCAALLLRLSDIPDTIDELRHALRRERREGERREGDKVDQRIFPRERRVGERRGPSREAYADTDPGMRLSEFEEVVIELAENDMEDVEQTQVRARASIVEPSKGSTPPAMSSDGQSPSPLDASRPDVT
jgi:hypothetical protein